MAPIFCAGPAGTDGDRFFTPMAWNWDLKVPGNKEFIALYRKAYPNAPYPPADENLGQATLLE